MVETADDGTGMFDSFVEPAGEATPSGMLLGAFVYHPQLVQWRRMSSASNVPQAKS